MPFLSEEEVDELHKKIEALEETNSGLDRTNQELNKTNQAFKEEIQQKATKLRGAVAVCIILLLCLIGAVLTGFVFKGKPVAVETKEPIIVRDTVYIEKSVATKEITKVAETEDVITYGVQIGAYKKFDATFSSCVHKVTRGSLNFYILGDFLTLSEAKDFKKLLLALDVEDTIIVKMKNGDLLD